MTPEEVIEMSREAGFNRLKYVHPKTGIHYSEAYAPDSLQRFAQLVWNAALKCISIATAPSNAVLGVGITCAEKSGA